MSAKIMHLTRHVLDSGTQFRPEIAMTSCNKRVRNHRIADYSARESTRSLRAVSCPDCMKSKYYKQAVARKIARKMLGRFTHAYPNL